MSLIHDACHILPRRIKGQGHACICTAVCFIRESRLCINRSEHANDETGVQFLSQARVGLSWQLQMCGVHSIHHPASAIVVRALTGSQPIGQQCVHCCRCNHLVCVNNLQCHIVALLFHVTLTYSADKIKRECLYIALLCLYGQCGVFLCACVHVR